MEKHLEVLGHRYRDVITNYEGVCDSVCFDLYGCVQYCIRSQKLDKDGKIENGHWFDSSRLTKLSNKRVMEVPAIYKFKNEQPTSSVPAGPANKPARP